VAAYCGFQVAKNSSLQRVVFNSMRLDRIETARMRQLRELRFLAYVFAHRQQSKSQLLQDLWVCFELGELRDGFFVEFGATNGVTNSNTYLLETKFNWRGLLAEPNPFWHAQLAASRRAAIEHRCVSSSSGQHVRFLTTNASDPELSGIAEFADADCHARTRADDNQSIQVETVSLADLLRQHNAPSSIDYLSIDTEGSEYEILSNFDFSHRSKLISVEQNSKTEPKIEALLTSKGYVRVFRGFSQWDGWYVSREQLERTQV
jgi:FkbM family methyltransferase